MTTSYTVPDDPKMLRETLCVAQGVVSRHVSNVDRRAEHVARLGRLIAECDRHRPVGVDGKHGTRHTPTCGCDDVTPSGYRQRGEKPCSSPSCPLVFAHAGPCAPPGIFQFANAELLLNMADEAQKLADNGIEPLLNTTLAQMLRRRAQAIAGVAVNGISVGAPFGMRR